jgi:glyoxylase-like metal-dependent hydrolase (beta-lactamase superfamily II)
MTVSNMTTPLGARILANPRTGATVHTYVAPPDGLFVTSHLVETEHELTVIDAQFRPEHAAEVKAYADSLSKPIARMIVTHAHPDHFVGAKTFGDIPIHAAAEARDFIAQAGPAVIEHYGFKTGVAVPTHLLVEGSQTLDGLTFEFRVMKNAEATENVVVLLPELGVLVGQDIVYNGTHLYLDRRTCEGWRLALAELRRLRGYDLVLAGHGEPATPAVYDEVEGYLDVAERVFRDATSAQQVRDAMVRAYPNATGVTLLDLGLQRMGLT